MISLTYLSKVYMNNTDNMLKYKCYKYYRPFFKMDNTSQYKNRLPFCSGQA